MTIYLIQEITRELLALKLGDNSESGEMFQILVKHGTWFGAVVNDPSSYSLVGCTVCPAFTFEDFELANRKTLISMCPEHKAIINKLTRSH
jgi:predicted cupin superfamily sugar epimerase